MANPLAAKIRTLQLVKIELDNTEAGSQLVNYAYAVLSLDDASDAYGELIGNDADQTDIAEGLVDLADVFDDVNLNPDQETKLNASIAKLLKNGTPDQIETAKGLFAAILIYGKAARDHNKYFNDLLATIPV